MIWGMYSPQTKAQFYRYQFLHTCQQVRGYRNQVRPRGLDNRELATLEYEYCVLDDPYYRPPRRLDPRLVAIPSAAASQDCIDVTIMTRLALAYEPYSTNTRTVSGLQQVLCTLPNVQASDQKTIRWRNDRSAKFGDNWYYPNGQNAKFGNAWYYPNGQNAKYGDSWYYPNSENAKFGRSWYYPDGDRADLSTLLAWSCGILGQYECDDRLADLQLAQGIWYDLTVVELSSRAYQRIYNYSGF